MNNTKTVLMFSIFSVTIFAAGFFSAPSQPVKNTTVECPDQQPPEVTVENNNTVKNPESTTANYIQAPHHELEYSLTGDTLKIEDVDTYGELFGSSMQPTIFSGNTVLDRDYNGQDLEEGQIIRYEAGEEDYRIHRIKGDYEEWGYVNVQGDNARYTEKVETENITHVIVGVLYE